MYRDFDCSLKRKNEEERGKKISLHFSIAYIMKAGGVRHSYTYKLVNRGTPESEMGR